VVPALRNWPIATSSTEVLGTIALSGRPVTCSMNPTTGAGGLCAGNPGGSTTQGRSFEVSPGAARTVRFLAPRLKSRRLTGVERNNSLVGLPVAASK